MKTELSGKKDYDSLRIVNQFLNENNNVMLKIMKNPTYMRH